MPRPPSGRARPMTAREQYVQFVQNGGGMRDPNERRPGAPPRSGKPASASTTRYLKQVMQETYNPGSSRKGGVRRPRSAAGSSSAATAPPTATVEDLADEVFQLKKEILAFRNERDLLRSQVHQLEMEGSRKDQAIGQLAEAMQSGNPAARRKGEETAAVVSLKQSIRGLRADLAARDAEIERLTGSLKYTQIEELELELATYAQELMRLRAAQQQDEDGGSFPQPGGGAGLASAAGVSAVAMRTVKEKNRILELENERLSSDLEQALRAAYMLREDLANPIKEDVEERYKHLPKSEMLQKLLEFDSKFQLIHKENTDLKAETEAVSAERDKYKQAIGSKPTETEEELREENARLKEQNERLLAEREAVIKAEAEGGSAFSRSHTGDTTVFVDKTDGDDEDAGAALLRSRHTLGGSATSLKSTLSRKSTASTATRKALAEAAAAAEAAATADDPPISKVPVVQSKDDGGDEMQSRAALAIQKNWRRREAQKRTRFLQEHKEQVNAAITTIQAALRGHAARKRLNTQLDSDDWVKIQVADDDTDDSKSTRSALSRKSKASTHSKAPSKGTGLFGRAQSAAVPAAAKPAGSLFGRASSAPQQKRFGGRSGSAKSIDNLGTKELSEAVDLGASMQSVFTRASSTASRSTIGAKSKTSSKSSPTKKGLSPRKSPSAASAKSSPKTAALWAAGGNDNDSDGSIAEDIPDAGDDSDDDF